MQTNSGPCSLVLDMRAEPPIAALLKRSKGRRHVYKEALIPIRLMQNR